ncbi:MAG: DUF3078 domain-containing protein [Flavobacteriales bacterium]|nr:DUF3078 domain-containing protein [Flavobacteriales bacterium]
MKKLFIGLLVLTSTITLAQTTEAEGNLKQNNQDTLNGWEKGGTVGLTFQQVSLTNWAAGGQNSFALNAATNLFANYKKRKSAFDNSLDLAYGVIRQGNRDAAWLKSDDRIDFSSKYGRQLKGKTFFAALYNFKSQFAAGYANLGDRIAISRFAAPAYSLLAIGIDLKPNDFTSVFIAPLTWKATIVGDQDLANAGAYGVEAAVYDDLGQLLTKGKMLRNEIGGYLKFQFKKELVKNITFETKLDLFSNYINNPQNIDVNWQVLINMKINDFLSASLTTHLIYDDDIDIGVDTNDDGIVDKYGPRTQFKEVFGVGLNYKF